MRKNVYAIVRLQRKKEISMKLRTKFAAVSSVFAAFIMTCTGCSTRTVGKMGELPIENAPVAEPSVTTEAPTAEPTTEPVPEDKRVHVIAAGDNLIHYSVSAR